MRSARLTALVLALGLVLAVGAGVDALSQSHDAGVVSTPGAAALIAQPDARQPAAALFERGHRREAVSSQRWTKHPLMFLAVLAALLGAFGLSFQRARAALIPRPLTSRWSRSSGRAPPRFRLSVV